MSLPTFNTKSPTIKRILKEAAELSTNPDPTLHAAPLESNLFEWHFTLRGPPSTPYAAGAYHGRIILPQQYPLRPPSFRFMTPSGRFEPNREICLSISGHHEETWQPAWGIRTALWALRAFMEGGAKGQVGGMEMGEAERKRLAEESKGWRCVACGKTNEETLKEQEEGGGDSAGQSQADIPEELRFGFKDEMKSEKRDESTQKPQLTAGGAGRNSIQGPERHEAPTTSSSSPVARPASTSSSAVQVPSGPTLNAASPMSQQRGDRPPPATQASSQEAVPGWIDKAIVGLVATLLVMIIKKLMA